MPGSRVTVGPRDDSLTVSYAADGHEHPPNGVCGGGAGYRYDTSRTHALGRSQALSASGHVDLCAGETIAGVSNGDGDGPQRHAIPSWCEPNVERRLVSIGPAREAYHVEVEVLEDGRCVLDRSGTARLRRDLDTASSS